ncbi:hypothetical protein ABIF30_006585 [Bradyrhizobium elkanii]|jgi:hypothetical protein
MSDTTALAYFGENEVATINPTISYINPTSVTVTWSGMMPGDDGAAVEVAQFQNWVAQMAPGAATMQLLYSNDGASFGALGSAINGFPSHISDRARYVKPFWASGSGGPADVTLYCYTAA